MSNWCSGDERLEFDGGYASLKPSHNNSFFFFYNSFSFFYFSMANKMQAIDAKKKKEKE